MKPEESRHGGALPRVRAISKRGFTHHAGSTTILLALKKETLAERCLGLQAGCSMSEKSEARMKKPLG